MANEIKMIGTIDLSMLNQRTRLEKKRWFYIKYITVSFWDNNVLDIPIGDFSERAIETSPAFTLLIGKNGVGKSSILRAIIDFFIDAKSENKKKRIVGVNINGICYLINGTEYQITNDNGVYYYYREQIACTIKEVTFPRIVASTMSVFDRFPIPSQYLNSRKNRYQVDFYQYVGPKANDNMYSSKSSCLLQALAYLGNITSREQILRINELFRFLGYDPKLTITARLRDEESKIWNDQRTQEALADEDASFIYSKIKSRFDNTWTHDVAFVKSATITDLSERHLRGLLVLRRAKLLQSVSCRLYRGRKFIDCDFISSGEFNLLCTILNIILRAYHQHTLLLIDEPEISQHPNWQIEIIPSLNTVLEGISCHVLISTHSHFLVSNLPTKRSQVVNIYQEDKNDVRASVLESETYGWSSEEVLLKVFNMATDRSRYLAEMVGILLNKIANNEICPSDVKTELERLTAITTHLSDVDPMKKVITSIIKEYNRHD